MDNTQLYDYIVVGAGISGCSVMSELKKHSQNILLIDNGLDVASGASGAAGAFLSPLLGKPNDFKNLVTKALKYSTVYYEQNAPIFFNNCGTIRIPKDEDDRVKFESYMPYMDFDFVQKNDGYLFDIGSVVSTYNICKTLVKYTNKLFNYEVRNIEFKNNIWILNDEFKCKNLILTTGASINLLEEQYFNIRAVWGQRIDIQTSTNVDYNYHKECSISKSIPKDKDTNIVSIGATHHRNVLEKQIDQADTKELLKKASDIIKLEDVKVIKEVAGARASSVDYFPMIGELIDSKKTIEEFPHLKNGTHVKEDRFIKYKNLFCLNGVGGRGFVLAPFLAKQLVDFIFLEKEIDDNLKVDRLFKRWVRKV